MSGTAGGRISAGVGANLIGQHAQDRNQEATIYVGNLDAQMSEELVWELFIQGGPVVNVYLPKDRVTNQHQGYGFVEFRSEDDADYAIKILNMIKVYGKPIRVNKASQDKKTLDVGANLFIGNLDPEVDEKLLYDTFSAFGVIVATPKIMRDPETGASRGFGFVSYDSFEASDAAIEAMNGQFLCNRSITVGYAFKKDTKGERHGTPAERDLAARQRAKQAQQNRPHTLFATGPRQEPQAGPPSAGPEAVSGLSGFAAGQLPPPPPAAGFPRPHAAGSLGYAMQPPGPPAPGAATLPPWAQPAAGQLPGAQSRPHSTGGMPPWAHMQAPPPGMPPPPGTLLPWAAQQYPGPYGGQPRPPYFAGAPRPPGALPPNMPPPPSVPQSR